MHWLLVATLLVGAESGKEKTPDPVSAYHQQSIRGWDLYIHKSLLREEKETGNAVLELVDFQLYDIQRRLPEQAVAALQKIPIWIESDNTRANPCACYHVSGDWLSENGFLREKEKGVEITSAKTFLEWTKEQPFMLLHELSHGYHDLVLGYDDARVTEAFQRAKKSGRYKEVLHIDGTKKKHYAIEDEKEYFGELTEAFFGTNDFYPFVVSELKQHDPEGYRLIEMLWNESSKKESSKQSDAAGKDAGEKNSAE